MGTGLLREGDADLLLGLLEAARHDGPGPLVPWTLLEGLHRLVPCDRDVCCHQPDHRSRSALLLQCVAAGGAREVVRPGAEGVPSTGWQLSWSVGGDRPAPAGHLVVSMPASPGEVRCFVFVRSAGPPFDARDRGVLELLRPHLHEVWLDAERRRAGAPPLSPREWEVLALAGAGLSTAEIATALWISVGTVRKHREHIREKLGVHSMAAAAARALPHAPGIPEVLQVR